jgi:hypothetical protein
VITLKCLLLPSILIASGVAFYAARPPKLKLLEGGHPYAGRNVYFGPSSEEAARLLGEPSGNLVDPADDPELAPYLDKTASPRVSHGVE